MDELRFRGIIREELCPMLQAQLAESTVPSSPRERLTASDGSNRLLVKPARNAGFRLALDRQQPFTPQERRLADGFIAELAEVAALDTGDYEPTLLRAIPRRVVAKHLGGGALLRRILGHLEDWSTRTYEGRRIVASIGIDPDASGSGVPLASLWEEPVGPVLTNSFDTMLVVGPHEEISGFAQLSSGESSRTVPYRMREIACWAAGGRISVTLSGYGEILVFQNKSLRFARRSGRWLHYVHDTNIRRLSPPKHRALRDAVYESCLDVSFARTGACLGVLSELDAESITKLVSEADLLAPPITYKTRLLAQAVGGKRFQSLDRRLRQELLSLDGATILDERGHLLTCGAIVQVPAGSKRGGGRTAAARKLGTVGLGLKVSEDGSVTGFRDGELVIST